MSIFIRKVLTEVILFMSSIKLACVTQAAPDMSGFQANECTSGLAKAS